MIRNLRRRRRRREARRCCWTDGIGCKCLSPLAPDLILIDSLQLIHVFKTLPGQLIRWRTGVEKTDASLLLCFLIQLLFVFLLDNLVRLAVRY